MTEPEADRFLRAPVYDSLQRRPQLMGLPQEAFMLVALFLVSLGIASRLDPLVLGITAALYLVLLPVLRRLFEKEPYLMDVVPRALRYAQFYSARGGERPTFWTDRVQKLGDG